MSVVVNDKCVDPYNGRLSQLRAFIEICKPKCILKFGFPVIPDSNSYSFFLEKGFVLIESSKRNKDRVLKENENLV